MYLPIWVAYQYLLGCVRIYALLTMLKTHWGNRAVSVKGNKIVRTGALADIAEAGNEESRSSSDSTSCIEDDTNSGFDSFLSWLYDDSNTTNKGALGADESENRA